MSCGNHDDPSNMKRPSRMTMATICVAVLITIIPTQAAPALPQSPNSLVIRDLYSGIPLPPASTGSCPYQLVALGVHGSRTSMVTRLLTLLGHYAGTQAQLTIAWKSQPLKWWEFWQLKESDTNFLLETSHPGFVNWSGIGYAGNYVHENNTALAGLMRNMSDVVRKLDKHCPWVVKEPRLCWTAVISSLVMHDEKGLVVDMDERRWRRLFLDMFNSALSACEGRPTIVLPSAMTGPAHVHSLLKMALQELQHVRALSPVDSSTLAWQAQLPNAATLHRHYLRHYGVSRHARLANNATRAAMHACRVGSTLEDLHSEYRSVEDALAAPLALRSLAPIQEYLCPWEGGAAGHAITTTTSYHTRLFCSRSGSLTPMHDLVAQMWPAACWVEKDMRLQSLTVAVEVFMYQHYVLKQPVEPHMVAGRIQELYVRARTQWVQEDGGRKSGVL